MSDTATTTMETTHESLHGHGEPLPAGVEAIDPEHDIDSRRTLFWLIVCTVGVFVCVWLLYLLFGYVITDERARKIDLLPPHELNQQRQWENETLSGRNGGRTIDDAMRRVLEKR